MIRLDRLTKVFDTPSGPVVAVDEVSFELPAGEICVLLGPSGCGKTTTMRMINRLIEPTGGTVFIDGRDTRTVDPIRLRRSIGYVIQQIGLFPNKTVAENICVVPDLLGWDRKKSRARAAELLELVAMEPAVFMDRYPKELSGGQQQRVGVIRALAADPPVLLMDEPFGAIDPINRGAIQDEFLRMQAALRKTVIFVSHDLDEAVKMADRVAIFRAGRLEQFATPDRLLANPATPFIETFLGTDRTLKRLRLVRIADVPLGRPGTVRRDDPVGRARELMQASGCPAVLVLDADGHPGAMVSGSRAGAVRGGTCGDCAEPIRATIPMTADLRSAVTLMFAHDMPLLPCVDAEGRIQGALTYAGIIRGLSARGASA
jgi:osmoprotectant transport system ATP-binding protein